MLAHVENRITYSGNGNATEFAYQFKILDRTDIKVLLTDADGKEKLLTKDYYVDVEKSVVRYPGYAVGAEVPESERPAVLPTGWKLTIYREVPVTQETDLPDQYPFNQVEAIGDKLTMIAQQLTDTTGRSLKIGVSKSTDIDTTIPWENGKSFRISNDGKTLELSEDPAKVLPLAQGVYTQTQAQAQSAAASARLAEDYKNAAETAKNAASLYATNAKNSAGEAKTYMDNAKRYSENVNVFTPSVSSDGVLSWTNKAGLPNPASVNIKGAKGDQGLQGDTGTAATITIGSVTTGAPGTNVSVTNSGTSTNAILNFTIPRGQPGAGGGTSVEVDAALSATSLNPVQNKVIKAALDNKVNKTDTIYEANLGWGGRNIVNGFSPVDAGMIPELGANRFAFGNAAGIMIEYSTDAGNTWLDYGSSDTAKTALFTTGSNHSIGKSEKDTVTTDCLLRVTIDTDAFRIYTVLNKFAIFMSTGFCTGCYCVVEASLENTPTEFVKFVNNASLNGNAGWNIINIANLITYGNAPTYQYGLIRFTFGCTGVGDASVPMTITKIMGFGGVGWNTPSNMAKTGLLYKYNTLQEATFPANVSAPAFIGNLTGTADKAKSDGEGNVITETYAKKDTANKWNALQSFKQVLLGAERYLSTVVSGTSHTPQMSVMHYIAIGTFTLNLQKIEASLEPSNSSVFTAYIESSADYPLHIETAGALKYIGSASDIAITSAGLLLNIMMLKDASGNLTSIVQASKLEGGA